MQREIRILPALNGYVVKVGCQTVVFESKARLSTALVDYLADPEKTEREFKTQAVNPELVEPCPAAERPREPIPTPADRDPQTPYTASEPGGLRR